MEAAALSSSAANNEEAEEEYELASSAVDQMPPGFRFHPTDLEIIDHYLLNKVIDRRFRAVAIREIDLNKCEPWDLPHKAAKMGGNEWFFFFEKETKYSSGTRTNRATASGYWKATGKDREIHKGGKMQQLVGMKKTLVFYKGRAPKGDRTNWVIHEYRLHGDFSAYNLSHLAKERWVVCRVFHKRDEANIRGAELARVDSFVDSYLVDSPTPLPPLTDDSSKKPSSGFAADQIIKPSTLMMLSNNKFQELHQLLPHLKTNSYSQYDSTPQNLNPHIDSVLPYESPSSLANYQHQDDGPSSSTMEWYLTNFPMIKGGDDDRPNSGNLAPDVYIGGKEPERMCKMEPVSFNNSAISPLRDTGLSTEMDSALKESESKKACEGLCFSPSILDMDSLWSY